MCARVGVSAECVHVCVCVCTRWAEDSGWLRWQQSRPGGWRAPSRQSPLGAAMCHFTPVFSLYRNKARSYAVGHQLSNLISSPLLVISSPVCVSRWDTHTHTFLCLQAGPPPSPTHTHISLHARPPPRTDTHTHTHTHTLLRAFRQEARWISGLAVTHEEFFAAGGSSENTPRKRLRWREQLACMVCGCAASQTPPGWGCRTAPWEVVLAVRSPRWAHGVKAGRVPSRGLGRLRATLSAVSEVPTPSGSRYLPAASEPNPRPPSCPPATQNPDVLPTVRPAEPHLRP